MPQKVARLIVFLLIACSQQANASVCDFLNAAFQRFKSDSTKSAVSRPNFLSQEIQTSSGQKVHVLGRPGPGISEDILVAAQRLVDEIECPIILYGSRQTGISEKTGQTFRPDSDVDLGVLTSEDFLRGNLVDPAFVNSFHPLFQHGPAAVMSANEALTRGYIIVSPSR